MATSRAFHTATLLNDGRVLVVGGATSLVGEVYSPSTGIWSTVASMAGVHRKHTATKLDDGRVVVIGGHNDAVTALASCEVYNPTNNTWVTAGSLTAARYAHTASFIRIGASGKILLAGGTSDGTVGLASCELFNPGTLTLSATGSMSGARWGHAAVALSDGSVLVSGGSNSGNVATAEIYALSDGTWKSTTSLTYARRDHNAALLSTGQVLVQGWTATKSEIYDPPHTIGAAGGLNGSFQVTVLDANNFTYSTPDVPYATTGLAGGTVTVVRAPSDNRQGPFVFDPYAGAAVTGKETTITQAIVAGHTYSVLTVADATSFPDAPGYVAFGFGTQSSTLPVRYLGKVSPTQLILDPSYTFPTDLTVGTYLTLLHQRGAYVPEHPEATGTFYSTASSAGRIAAQATIGSIVGAGLDVNQIIVYPGDRGLGNEGAPTSGVPKIADKVLIWGSDEQDADIDTARNS